MKNRIELDGKTFESFVLSVLKQKAYLLKQDTTSQYHFGDTKYPDSLDKLSLW